MRVAVASVVVSVVAVVCLLIYAGSFVSSTEAGKWLRDLAVLLFLVAMGLGLTGLVRANRRRQHTERVLSAVGLGIAFFTPGLAAALPVVLYFAPVLSMR